MRLSSCLLIVYLNIQSILGQEDKYSDENRPYKFGFNIEGYQHRQEEKDEKGLIKGEYGFITADGYYRVTVYATDENGDFRIISMKNYYVGFPPEDPQTTLQPPNQPGQGFTLPPRGGVQANPLSTPVRAQEKEGRREKDPIELTGLTACSDCLIPTTKKPGVGTRFGGGRGGGPGFGTRTQGGGQGFGGRSGGDSPVFGERTRGNTGGSQGGFGGSGGGRGNNGGAPGRGFGGTPRSGGFGGAPGGRDTPRGNTGFVGAGVDGSTGRGGGRGQFDNGSRNRGTGDGSGVTTPGIGRPEIGSVRDGLPRGVSMDDIKALLYTFNYTVGFHGHHEDGYRNGDKEGDYFFDGRDGVERKVEYIANEFGYQPNITFIDLPENDVRRPKEETEKEYGLKGYEFKWFYRK